MNRDDQGRAGEPSKRVRLYRGKASWGCEPVVNGPAVGHKINTNTHRINEAIHAITYTTAPKPTNELRRDHKSIIHVLSNALNIDQSSKAQTNTPRQNPPTCP